jgi:hypothetical protein
MQRFRILPLLMVACFATALLAQAPSSAPKPNPELNKLSVLLGHWTYVGEYKPGPFGPGGKITGVYEAQKILDGFFMQAHFTEKGAVGEFHGLEVDGYDPVNKNIASTVYQNDGSTFSGTVSVAGNTVTWAGKFVIEGKEYQFREPFVLAPDLMSATAKGDISVDGQTWTPFFEAQYTKAKPAPKK